MDTSKPIYIILEILFCFIFVTSCKIQHETIVVSSCNKNYIMRIPTGYQLTTFIGYHGDDCNVYCYPNDGHNAIIYIYPAKAMVDNSGILLGKLVYHYYGQDIFFSRYKEKPHFDIWKNEDSTFVQLFGVLLTDTINALHQDPNYSCLTKGQIDSIFNCDTVVMGGYGSSFSWKEIKIKNEIVVGYYNVPRKWTKRFDNCLKSIKILP